MAGPVRAVASSVPPGTDALPLGVAALLHWGWMVLSVLLLSALLGLLRQRRAAEQRLRSLLRRADGLVWEGHVTREGGNYTWFITPQPSGLYTRLFGDRPAPQPGTLWTNLDVLDRAAMDACSTEALASGVPRYQQEFRVLKDGAMFWMQEQVSITPAGPEHWNLVGVVTDVTRWRQAEQALKAKEAQVHQILARADCLLWHSTVVREGTDGVKWSTFEMPTSGLYARLFGERDPASGRLWSLLHVPELPEMNARSRAAVLGGQSGYEQEFHVVRADETIWLREKVSITPVGADAWNLVGVLIDVTAQHAAEAAVLEVATRHRLLFERAPAAILELDCTALVAWAAEQPGANGAVGLAASLAARPAAIATAAERVRVVDVNTAARRLFKVRDAEEFQARLRDIVPVDAIRALGFAFAGTAADATAIETALDICDLEGRIRHTWVRCWLGGRGEELDPARIVLAIVDLTDLRRAESALQAEKERLTVMLHAMTEGVVTTDPTGRVQYMNPAAAGMTCTDAASVEGHMLADVCRWRAGEGDGDAPLEVPVARIVCDGTTFDLPAGARLLDRDGSVRLVEGRCAPIRDAAGAAVGSILVFRDVTARERFGQELARASRLESIGVLAGGIAHDFNNILTVVVGNLNLARLSAEDAAEVRRSLDEAERAALQARDLTQQLLTFAKGGSPVRAAVNLAEVVRRTAAFTVRGSTVRSECELPAELWSVDGDRGQLVQVVQQIVLNAVQAMPSGGVVRVSAANLPAGERHDARLAPGDYVRLSIADAGSGIAPEHLPRIFDPFFTTKPGGSGLGLATVYSIVKKHRGLADVRSEPGRGTTFDIWLPALPATVLPATAAAPVVEGRLAGRVLFMDDEDAIRRLAGGVLRRLGCTVVVASDGAEAIERFAAARAAGTPFDLVIMDLTVPGGMGGREALEQLRAIEPAVKAIVSSGYSSDPVLAEYREHGFAGRVAKPYQLGDFIAVVREVLGRGAVPQNRPE